MHQDSHLTLHSLPYLSHWYYIEVVLLFPLSCCTVTPGVAVYDNPIKVITLLHCQRPEDDSTPVHVACADPSPAHVRYHVQRAYRMTTHNSIHKTLFFCHFETIFSP